MYNKNHVCWFQTNHLDELSHTRIIILGGRCVLKMDHHCPWINSCVGWGNHAHFTFFLFFATLGCAHASVILATALYRSIHRVYYIYHATTSQPLVFLGLYGMILCVFALGFSIGVVIAVGMLLYFQVILHFQILL